MKSEAVKEFYALNGVIKYVREEDIFRRITKPPIYEVIRVVNGVPIFLEDHLERMYSSANAINHNIFLDDKGIRQSIKDTILHNDIDNYNIKLISGEAEGIGDIFLVYCVETTYPPKEYYENGINTILYNYERNNPNVKVLVTSFKEDVAKQMKEKNAYEALLVRKDGFIPEGSRSNLFYVKEDKLFSAPKEEILLGITRKHILQIAENQNIELVEKSLHVDDIKNIDGAFISGTSVTILPISKIDNVNIASIGNKVVTLLYNEYNKMIRDYVEKNKEYWI